MARALPVRLARADARFLLPRPVTSAVVIDGLPGWREALAAAGVEVGPRPDPVLAVAPARRAADAVAAGAPMVLLEGYHPRAARRSVRAAPGW